MRLPSRIRSEHTPLQPWMCLATTLLAAVGPGCAHWDSPPEAAASPDTHLERALVAEPPVAAGLRVRLAFGREADLDLYVSDPLQETVYYANSPSRSGGFLESDRRCVHPAPRIEAVHFEAPPAGRFRVGIDFPEACAESAERVPYLLAIERDGERTLQRGEITLLRFEPIVLEFDVAGE